jgi:hypothetical protein
MRKVTSFMLALLVAVASVGVVADEVFARGGGGGGGGNGGGGPAPGPSGPGGEGVAGDPDAPRLIIDEGVLALPRLDPGGRVVIVTGCTTTNFGAQGGITPCPVNR